MFDQDGKIRQRTLQYWYVDGLTEIAFGVILLILAAYFFIQATLPEESFLHVILDVGFILIILGSGWLAGRLVNAAKNRLTYPRTGYVAYPKARGQKRWIGAILGMFIGAGMAGLVAAAPASLAWMPAISGLLLAAVLLYLGYRFGLARFYLLSLIAMATGVGLALAGIGDILGAAVFYACSGLSLLISGGLTLWTYLRSTSPAGEIHE